jgi:hypothetical protein
MPENLHHDTGAHSLGQHKRSCGVPQVVRAEHGAGRRRRPAVGSSDSHCAETRACRSALKRQGRSPPRTQRPLRAARSLVAHAAASRHRQPHPGAERSGAILLSLAVRSGNFARSSQKLFRTGLAVTVEFAISTIGNSAGPLIADTFRPLLPRKRNSIGHPFALVMVCSCVSWSSHQVPSPGGTRRC